MVRSADGVAATVNAGAESGGDGGGGIDGGGVDVLVPAPTTPSSSQCIPRTRVELLLLVLLVLSAES